MSTSDAPLTGPPGAVPWLLENGVAVVLELSGDCMSPGLPRGRRIRVERLAPSDLIAAGDLVVLVTAQPNVILLHRVIHVFRSAGRCLVMHQGDAPNARPGVAPRENVVGRAIAPADGGPPLPALDQMAARDRVRFVGRRLAGAAYAQLRNVRDTLPEPAGLALRVGAGALRWLASAA